jgi:hypothetical protein
MTTNLAGSADPAACGPLDACGVTGTITSAFGQIREGELAITAVAERRRPWRDLRTAVGLTRRGNGRRIAVIGVGAWEGGGSSGTTASIRHPDAGPPCADRAAPQLGFIFLVPQASGRRAEYVNQRDALRTRCPGPRLPDLAPDDEPIATGTTPIRAFAGRRLVLRLTGDRPFAEGPYSGRIRTDLAIHVRRIRVIRSTVANSPFG